MYTNKYLATIYLHMQARNVNENEQKFFRFHFHWLNKNDFQFGPLNRTYMWVFSPGHVSQIIILWSCPVSSSTVLPGRRKRKSTIIHYLFHCLSCLVCVCTAQGEKGQKWIRKRTTTKCTQRERDVKSITISPIMTNS